MSSERERGAAAVEFALVGAFVLLPLLFGTITFGFALFQQQAASHAAREGARVAAVGVSSCSGFTTTVRQRGKGAAITSVAVAFAPSPGVVGGEVRVDVLHSVNLTAIGWLPFIPQSLDLTQTGRARVEQPSAVTSC